MIEAQGYGRAAVRAAADTGLPVWQRISAARRPDGILSTFTELGGGDSFEDLLRALADPSLAAVTVMHSTPQVIPDAIEIIRGHFAGLIGAYPETGSCSRLSRRTRWHPKWQPRGSPIRKT